VSNIHIIYFDSLNKFLNEKRRFGKKIKMQDISGDINKVN